MAFIVDDNLNTETTTEPMEAEDLLVAIIVSAHRQGSVSYDEISATCEAANRDDFLALAKELEEGESEIDPALDDPDPGADDIE